ncbi:hypothetical protein BLNAU_10992 [Blattamonas nauphoetae]|uniref:Uncharacterized protein n=1 Tax=Blattamonas nauphoetae TaxID=2049346 RepID=A0ABQ9XQZ6_9EUKA|nr:hypothetical protein BLNAU_10992 [Blattamonas nauphoetae]
MTTTPQSSNTPDPYTEIAQYLHLDQMNTSEQSDSLFQLSSLVLDSQTNSQHFVTLNGFFIVCNLITLSSDPSVTYHGLQTIKNVVGGLPDDFIPQNPKDPINMLFILFCASPNQTSEFLKDWFQIQIQYDPAFPSHFITTETLSFALSCLSPKQHSGWKIEQITDLLLLSTANSDDHVKYHLEQALEDIKTIENQIWAEERAERAMQGYFTPSDETNRDANRKAREKTKMWIAKMRQAGVGAEKEEAQRIEYEARIADLQSELDELKKAKESTEIETDRLRSDEAQTEEEEHNTRREELKEEKKITETERAKMEEEKKKAEMEQKKVEDEKRKADADRVKKEEEKKKAEMEQKKVEDEKRKADADRVKKEEEKKKAEMEQKKVEDEKRKADADRVKKEEEKKKAEKERVKVEQQKPKPIQRKADEENPTQAQLPKVRIANEGGLSARIQMFERRQEATEKGKEKVSDEVKRTRQKVGETEEGKEKSEEKEWVGTKSLQTLDNTGHELSPTTLKQTIKLEKASEWRTAYTFPIKEGEWELTIGIIQENPKVKLGFLTHPLPKDFIKKSCGGFHSHNCGEFTLWTGGLWKGKEFKPAGTNKKWDRVGQTAAIRVNMSTREARLIVDDEEQPGFFTDIPSPLCLGISTHDQYAEIEVLGLKQLK